MLFNSYEFIFVFLPISFFIYFYLNSLKKFKEAKLFLLFASLFFYSWWNVAYLPLILGSMVFNYIVGTKLSDIKHNDNNYKRILLTFGIISNIFLLGYFKYSDFFIENINFLTGENIPLLHLALPLAISFFTFQQIAYLVDSYRGETREYDFLNYAVFVTFFPQLIAGPIVHHKEMMPQFEDIKTKYINYKNIALGLSIFALGLFKKVAIADTLSVYANEGFNLSTELKFIEAWVTSLSYTFQLYFDFSGYTDMAIGAALLFNIKLPINFNSPYKAVNIQDFWRRWHITLSRFLRDYVYIPLGGSKKGDLLTYRNLFLTFLIGGIWHGAGWTFVVWGALHGIAMVIHRIWSRFKIKMNRFLAWFITFNFVNIAWVFFRAKDFEDALKVLKGMFALDGVILPYSLSEKFAFLADYGIEFNRIMPNIDAGKEVILMLFAVGAVALFAKNSYEFLINFKPKRVYLVFTSFLLAVAILKLNQISEFLYFNF
ncbi:MAG: MBOAT family protein [Epsilonproteobacteria bacterium]|nr:MBOAT family protein [Campylobacterota bacterium]